MAHPKHRNPTKHNRTATAPYNFVPLPEKVVKAADAVEQLPAHDGSYTQEDYKHSGYFEVQLETKSAVYIRGLITGKLFAYLEQNLDCEGKEIDSSTPYNKLIKNQPDFFHILGQNNPVLPGSSLRGMLRSMLEIVSYGKIDPVTDKRLFYRTVDNSSLGKAYRKRIMKSLPPICRSGIDTPVYQPRVLGGFYDEKTNGTPQIKTCPVARIDLNDPPIRTALGISTPTDLYDLRGGNPNNPNQTPKWTYQHRDVWVTIHPENDYFFRQQTNANGNVRHPDLYLRFIKATSLSLTKPVSESEDAGFKKGKLVLTGHISYKHLAFVFLVPDTDKPEFIDIPNSRESNANSRLLDLFHDDEQLTRWQKNAFPFNRPNECSGCNDNSLSLKNGWLKEGDPVFFLADPDNPDQAEAFGRAQMFRLPYKNTPQDLVPVALRQEEDIDYADAIFGFVGKKAKSARRGRIDVTDANLDPGEQEKIYCDRSAWTPEILATPKPSSFQNYLVQKQENKNKLSHYDSQDTERTVIRGSNFYWHQGDRSENHSESPSLALQDIPENSTQHTRFRPLNSGVNFTFRIYFYNLSDRELGAVSWILHPYGNEAVMQDEQKGYCPNLGMAKSLGMGAVKLQATLHRVNRGKRYQKLFDENRWESGIENGGENLSKIETLEELTKPFEEHILSQLMPEPKCEKLSKLSRIAMFLKMLEWPGQDPQAIRQMPLEEFKQRKILPDPSDPNYKGSYP